MKMRVVQFQPMVVVDRSETIRRMEAAFEERPEIREGKADLVLLPEMFSTPYGNSYFPEYAESEGGMMWRTCSNLARKYHLYLQAGTVPERDPEGHIYNTAYMFDREGRQIGKHRKVHLFDINIRGGQYFRESDTLTAGDSVTVFDTEFGKMGICVCFDCRFPEIFRAMVDRGAKVILVPAAFNLSTGPAHWQLMFRSRAVDNQCFVFGTSEARDMDFSYHAWGHSLAVSPWGDVLGELDEKPGVLVTEVGLDQVDSVREQLPLLSARRQELYR